MISFRDKTFCSSPNCKGECGRQWTPKLQKEAEKWWGDRNPPVAFSNYCKEKELKNE